MDGSNLIFIVMPIVMVLALAVLIILPFYGARGSGGSHSGGRHPGGPESQGQVPGRPAAPDAGRLAGH